MAWSSHGKKLTDSTENTCTQFHECSAIRVLSSVAIYFSTFHDRDHQKGQGCNTRRRRSGPGEDAGQNAAQIQNYAI
jgi:hypothetical protein